MAGIARRKLIAAVQSTAQAEPDLRREFQARPVVNPSARLIELVGPPGVGKSTLVETWKAQNSNILVYTHPYFRDPQYSAFFASSLLHLLPTLARMYLNHECSTLTKRDIAYMTILTGWASTLQHQLKLTGKTIVLDEGPIGLLGKLHRFGSFPEGGREAGRWHRHIVERWARHLDLIVQLDAPLTTLGNRVRSRTQQFEMSEMTNEVMLQHLEQIRASLDHALAIISAVPRPPQIHYYDTSQFTPQELCNTLLAASQAAI